MTSNSSLMPQPAAFGGYGRQTGSYGGIQGVEFAARCPPDVQRDTRIIAICGIPEGDAAPQDDGWFFSDFFLFYQMFSSRDELPQQLWLSSCTPAKLINEHNCYVHGAPNEIAGDRRVVMNKEMLPKDEFKAGFRTFPPKDLLERFLATLKSEIQEAARTKQPVLVLIFGHGKPSTSEVLIGCGEGGSLKLTQARLASVLKKEVQTTLILTCCYSGGWVMMPNFDNHFDVKPAFNHSFLTAAGADNESWSWPISQSIGRQAGGSVFATCLLNSILTVSDEELNDKGQRSGGLRNKLFQAQEADDEEEFSHSMAALTQLIVAECKARCGTLGNEHHFSFAAQDDLWIKAWGKRTGIPLLDYKERWQNLPVAQLKKDVYPPASSLAGSIMSKSATALHNIVKVKATIYMNSKPGADNSGCNTNCHGRFHRLIEGTHFDFDTLNELNEILEYRLGQISLVVSYCEYLGLGMPDDRHVDKFDAVEWRCSQRRAADGTSAERSKAAIDLLERFRTIQSRVFRLRIFDLPFYQQGLSYSKPIAYLAVRLAESPMSVEQIHQKLEDLLQRKLEDARCAARSPLGVAVLNQPEIKSTRRRIYEKAGKLTQRLRSLSPQKRSHEHRERKEM